MKNERDYFLRGNPFLYEESNPHFVIKWIEQIRIETLQESVQEVINKSPWVCWSLTNRVGAPELVKANGYFAVHDCYKKRPIPETPGGYLFSISCESDTLHFVYDHFLTDGRGIIWFICEILLEYCNRVYGTNFSYTPLRSENIPEFSELLKCTSLNSQAENSIPLRTVNKKTEHLLLRINKNEIVQNAMSLKIRPFALLLSIICRGVMSAKELSSISYSFAMDARKSFNCEDVFYNFSTDSRNMVDSQNGINGIRKHFNDAINNSTEEAAVKGSMSRRVRVLNALSEMKIDYTAKRKVYSKISDLERVTVRISYLGTVFKKEYEILNQYVSDFMIWMDSDHEEFICVETTLNDQAFITLSHCLQNRTVLDCLINALNESNIKDFQIIDGGKYNAADTRF